MKVDYPSFFVKTGAIVAIFATLPFGKAIIASFFVTWVYQYIVALIFGVKAMPTMDALCFIGDDTAVANFSSASFLDPLDFDYLKGKLKKFMADKPKLRYSVRQIFGDYYYEDTIIDESIEYVLQKIPVDLKNDKDIEEFIGKHLNK